MAVFRVFSMQLEKQTKTTIVCLTIVELISSIRIMKIIQDVSVRGPSSAELFPTLQGLPE